VAHAEWRGRLRRWYGVALDLVFPPACAVCGRDGALLCGPCAAEFPVARPPRCSRCWTPGDAAQCDSCRADPPAFAALRSAFVFADAARDAVLALKYGGLQAVAPVLVDRVEVRSVLAPGARVDVVTAVPMSGWRRRRRGYNQAERLARAIAARLDAPYEAGLLGRARRTSPQARQASRAARRANVQGAFRASARAAGRNVLVVDDVTTTGATLDACARALLTAGASDVHAWAFARED
jgi:ComF family protein